MKEQNYLTKNKFMPVFSEALAHVHYQSLWQAHGYLPFPTVRGCSLDYVCTLQLLAGAQYCPQALINPN